MRGAHASFPFSMFLSVMVRLWLKVGFAGLSWQYNAAKLGHEELRAMKMFPAQPQAALRQLTQAA